MASLAGLGSRAILFGTGRHDEGSTLPPVPAVPHTVHAVADALTRHCGLPADQLTTVVDPRDPPAMLRALIQVADQADDVLLVYYVGHGVLNADGDLHLATQATVNLTRGMASYEALPYREVVQALAMRCRARTVLIILDCCYADRATLPKMSSAILASADRDVQAIARPGETYPAFSGELIRILNDGAPRGPAQLTVRDVHRQMSDALQRAGAPLPRLNTGDRAADLVLTDNRAYQHPEDPDHDDSRPGTGSLQADECPYRGLDSYTLEDADLFFGRAGLTEQVIRRLSDRVWSGGLGFLIGASGSGKSSLLQAGVLPAIIRGDLGIPGSVSWPYLRLASSGDPAASLAGQLADLAQLDQAKVAKQLSDDPAAIRTIISKALDARWRPGAPRPSQRRLLIIADQFEELFAPDVTEESRQTFTDALHAAATAADDGQDQPAALVIIGLRADFYAACAQYPVLARALAEQQTTVDTISTDELKAAIGRPAETAGLTLQPGLTELLLRDMGAEQHGHYDSASLPYLSYALLRTWHNRHGRLLTVRGYTETGGVSGAIAQQAEETYHALSTQGQKAAEQLLLRLVNVGADTPDTRRTVSRQALRTAQPDQATQDALDAFAAARLITVDSGTVQLAHEALIRSWPRLADLINADRDGLRVRQQLSIDAERWDAARRDTSLLYRGTRLAVAREAAAAAPVDPLAQDFLATSRGRESRATRIRRAVTATLAVLTLIAAAATGLFAHQVTVADQQRDQAVSRELVSRLGGLRADQPGLARQLAVTAYRMAPNNQTTAALLTGLSLPGALSERSDVSAVADDPRLPILAVATSNRIILQNATSGALAYAIRGAAYQLAFSPGGQLLAAAENNGVIRLWDVSHPGHPVPVGWIPGRGSNASSLQFSQNGSLLAVAYQNNTCLVWNVTAPRHPVIWLNLTRAGAIAFGSGSVVAIGQSYLRGSETLVVLVRVTGPGHSTLVTHTLISGPGSYGGVTALAISPDQRSITIGTLWGNAVSATDGYTAIVSLVSGTHPRLTTLDSSDPMAQIAYSPDGQVLALRPSQPGGPAPVELWDLTGPKPVRGWTIPQSDADGGMAFSPDGSTLSTGDSAQVLQWRVTDPDQAAALSRLPEDTGNQPDHSVDALAFSEKRDLLVTGSRDGLTHLWRVTSPGRPTLLGTIPAEPDSGGPVIYTVAVSPDGRLVATGGDMARLWNVTDPGHPVRLWTDANTGAVPSIAFSPDGKLLVADQNGGRPLLWRVGQPGAPVRLPMPRGQSQTSPVPLFGPSGSVLQAVSGNELWAWNLADPAHPVIVRGSTVRDPAGGGADAAALSPDGQTLAVGLDDGGVQLWHLRAPGARPALLSTTAETKVSVASLAFSADGGTLAGVGATVDLWDVADPAKPTLLDSLPAPLGAISRVAASPSGGIVAVADGVDRVELWDTSPASLVQQMCRGAGTPITPAQWQTYIGAAAPYDPPCR